MRHRECGWPWACNCLVLGALEMCQCNEGCMHVLHDHKQATTDPLVRHACSSMSLLVEPALKARFASQLVVTRNPEFSEGITYRVCQCTAFPKCLLVQSHVQLKRKVAARAIRRSYKCCMPSHAASLSTILFWS